MSGRLRRAALLLALVATLTLPVPARAGIADRIGVTFSVMAADFVKAAQPLESIVIAVDGDTLYLDAGEKAGAQVGQELTVYRKGEPFYHPITGKILGHYETVLGYAQIRQVQPQFSQAQFIPVPDAPRPQTEDGARITRGRIRLAVTPVLDLTTEKADTRRVPYMLASMLERSKRFQVIDPLTVGDLFATGSAKVEEVLAQPERAVSVAKNLDVSGWLVPTLIERNGVVYLDMTWISAVTGTPLFSRRRELLPAGAVEEQRFPWEPRPED